MKKTLSILSYYILPIGLLILSSTIASQDLFVKFGQSAMYLVLFNLFLKPVAKITNIKKLKRLLVYRRQFGIASFWFFAFHGLGMWQTFQLTEISYYLDPKYNILYGALAAIGMTILFITSNNLSVRKLKKNWKRIQYIAYPTLFLILYHAALAEGEKTNFYILSGLFIVLKIFELSKFSFKKNPPTDSGDTN